MSRSKDLRADSLRSARSGSTIANIILKEILRPSYDERSWNLRYLKERFQIKRLEVLYKRYEQRAQIGTFTTYLVVQSLICILYIAWIAIDCRISKTCNALDIPDQLPEIAGYSVILAMCIALLLLVYNERVFKKKPWLLYLFSSIVVITLEAVDIGLVVNSSRRQRPVQPDGESDAITREESPVGFSGVGRSSSGFLLVSKTPILSLYSHLIIYLFLPISRKDVTVLFGAATSIICIGLFLGVEISYEPDPGSWRVMRQFLADLVFYFCLNFIGFYVRYVGEINMRRGFLDKRGCIETTFKLKYEKEQEENLLLSIIPKHIFTQVREAVWNHVELRKQQSIEAARRPFNELFVEKHENVSILFADICNFTPLTTTLTTEKLVQTLNDLFGKFDDSAEKHNCMRIKILGDCYYSVAGVPQPDPKHAHNSVEMGLEMIHLIRDVRYEHNVPVNMRIGIHTGYILSGLIGLKKWQYDIWSNDVTIANKMEATGRAGAVHITAQTKACLGTAYTFEAVEQIADPLLRRHDIDSFLIRPTELPKIPSTRDLPKMSRFPSLSESSTDTSLRGEFRRNSVTDSQPRRGSVVGTAASIVRKGGNLQQRYSLQALHLRRSTMRGSTAPDDDSNRRRSVLMDSSLKSFQKMLDSAGEFMRDEIEKLPLRKYDQWLHPEEINPVVLWFKNKSWERLYVLEHDPLFKFYILASFIILNAMGVILLLTENFAHITWWIVYTILFVFLVLLLPCLWVNYIWDQIIDPHYELDTIEEPKHRMLKWFYRAAKKINTNLAYRTIIFLITSVLMVSSAMIDVTTASCYDETPKNFTYRCALAVMVIFMFLRIYHILKWVMACCCLILYFLYITGAVVATPLGNVFSNEYFGYEHIIPNDKKEYSHFVYLAICAVFFLLMDRQNEYMHRLDYQWKRQLKTEQQQASETKMVNKMLLQNILPHHVAEQYLSSKREPGKLYSEDYANVAVVFASIPDYMEFYTDAEINQGSVICLKVLNEIISAFDKLLFDGQFSRVEKIKVISSTYMAASGLEPGRKDSLDYHDTRGMNAATMVRFAAAMMRELRSIKYGDFDINNPDFQLRVGVCVGPVIAGVVGAHKPLYDIWGNTVNVASRMDYTGVPGKIQVPEETADSLGEEGIVCSFRDVIEVKGKGPMRTYFVDLDERLYVKQEIMVQKSESISALSESGDELFNPDDTVTSASSGLLLRIDGPDKPSFRTTCKIDLRDHRTLTRTDTTVTTVSSSERDFIVTPVVSRRASSNVDEIHMQEIITVSALDIHAEPKENPDNETSNNNESKYDNPDDESSVDEHQEDDPVDDPEDEDPEPSLSQSTIQSMESAITKLDLVIKSIEFEDGPITSVEDEEIRQLNEAEAEDDCDGDLTPPRIYTKKDSGYGSQGQLKVDKARLEAATLSCSDDRSLSSSPVIEPMVHGNSEINKKYYDYSDPEYFRSTLHEEREQRL